MILSLCQTLDISEDDLVKLQFGLDGGPHLSFKLAGGQNVFSSIYNQVIFKAKVMALLRRLSYHKDINNSLVNLIRACCHLSVNLIIILLPVAHLRVKGRIREVR